MSKTKYCNYCGKKVGILKRWTFYEGKPIHIKCKELKKEQNRIAKIEGEVAEEQKEYVERIIGINIKKKDKDKYFRRLMDGETETSAKGGLESFPKDEPDINERRRRRKIEKTWGLKSSKKK